MGVGLTTLPCKKENWEASKKFSRILRSRPRPKLGCGAKERRKKEGFLDLVYEGVSKSFRTGRLERELQMVQLSATTCSYISILWVSLVSFAAITLCVASRRVLIVIVVYFVDSVRKLLDTPSYLLIFYGGGGIEHNISGDGSALVLR
jgi:hypothetical protein